MHRIEEARFKASGTARKRAAGHEIGNRTQCRPGNTRASLAKLLLLAVRVLAPSAVSRHNGLPHLFARKKRADWRGHYIRKFISRLPGSCLIHNRDNPSCLPSSPLPEKANRHGLSGMKPLDCSVAGAHAPAPQSTEPLARQKTVPRICHFRQVNCREGNLSRSGQEAEACR
jgi:hypothetical protein